MSIGKLGRDYCDFVTSLDEDDDKNLQIAHFTPKCRNGTLRLRGRWNNKRFIRLYPDGMREWRWSTPGVVMVELHNLILDECHKLQPYFSGVLPPPSRGLGGEKFIESLSKVRWYMAPRLTSFFCAGVSGMFGQTGERIVGCGSVNLGNISLSTF